MPLPAGATDRQQLLRDETLGGAQRTAGAAAIGDTGARQPGRAGGCGVAQEGGGPWLSLALSAINQQQFLLGTICLYLQQYPALYM